MKKKNPASGSSLKPVDVVTVHSRAYGEHTRSARGSIQPARLNDVLKRKSKELGVLTSFAREVHNLLRAHAGFFKEAMFWQHMLSRLHTVTDIAPVTMLKSLEGLELNSRNALKRFGDVPFVQVTAKDNVIAVCLEEEVPPYFKKPVTAYCYDVIILFFDNTGKAKGSEEARSRWMNNNEVSGDLYFTLPKPAGSVFYLLCLRLHTGNNGVPTNGITSQGMMVVCSGEVDER